MEIEIGYLPGPKLGNMLCNAKKKHIRAKTGVYSIQCFDCQKRYIGETGRDINTRISEHEMDIRRKNIKSAVALHMMENDHNLDTNAHKLIFNEPRLAFRKTKEALMIRATSNKMNTSKGAPVNNIWSSTLVNFLIKTRST